MKYIQSLTPGCKGTTTTNNCIWANVCIGMYEYISSRISNNNIKIIKVTLKGHYAKCQQLHFVVIFLRVFLFCCFLQIYDQVILHIKISSKC